MYFGVIMPIYNQEAYLHECMDSLLAQRFQDWVAFCIDDGSTDATSRILDEYAVKDARVRVLHRPNGGLCSARNAGIEYFAGRSCRYVGFLDGDDAFSVDWLQELHDLAERFSEPEWIRGRCDYIPTEGPTVHLKNVLPCRVTDNWREEKVDVPYAWHNIVRVCTGAMNRSFVRQDIIANRRFPLTVKNEGEDQTFQVEMAEGIKSCAVTDYRGYLYRVFVPTSLSQHKDYLPFVGYVNEMVRVFTRQKREFDLSNDDLQVMRNAFCERFNTQLSRMMTVSAKTDDGSVDVLHAVRNAFGVGLLPRTCHGRGGAIAWKLSILTDSLKPLSFWLRLRKVYGILRMTLRQKLVRMLDRVGLKTTLKRLIRREGMR